MTPARRSSAASPPHSRTFPMTLSRLLKATGLAALLAVPSAAQDQLVVKAGTLHTFAGDPIQNAVILIENGRITAIGSADEIEAPWNAKVVDATNMVVLPTWVLAHTPGGLSGGNENMANVPFLTVQDAIDPSDTFFDEAIRNGVGTLHVIPGNSTLLGGRGMVVRPYGKTVEDMTVRDAGGLKLSLQADRGNSRMAQIRALRNALKDAQDAKAELERQRTEWQKEKDAGATEKKEFDGEIDELKKPVVDLIDGALTGYLFVPSAAEVPEVARLKEQYPAMKLVLVLGPSCYKAADRLKELGYPIVLEDESIEYVERDPETGDETTVCPPKVFADAGIEFAISLSQSGNSARRYPWWQMATMVRHGVDRGVALRSLTTVPARILGVDAEFGTLEVGKVASLQVLEGDPLAATTWTRWVVLEGEVAYDKTADKRLQVLFGETAPASGEGTTGGSDRQEGSR